MYLQITTKCNMSCEHCCYSCTKYGRHGNLSTIMSAIDFAADYTDIISIGGGEPTLHPEFFTILERCLSRFDYVWMATNGSQTQAMGRLYNIILGEDFPECECDDPDYCDCSGGIYQKEKLTVALSQDCFHDPIDPRIVKLWKSRVGQTGFEIRDVTRSHNGVAAQGRAKVTGAGWSEYCVCSDVIIRPDGKLKLCGCANAPVIGDIWNGILDKWKRVKNSALFFHEGNCYNAWKRARRERSAA